MSDFTSSALDFTSDHVYKIKDECGCTHAECAIHTAGFFNNGGMSVHACRYCSSMIAGAMRNRLGVEVIERQLGDR